MRVPNRCGENEAAEMLERTARQRQASRILTNFWDLSHRHRNIALIIIVHSHYHQLYPTHTLYTPNTLRFGHIITMVAALRSAAASLIRARAPMAIARPAVARTAMVAPRFAPVRFYAASAGLSKSDIESRIVDVLKTFEKVDPSKVRFSTQSSAEISTSGLIVWSK